MEGSADDGVGGYFYSLNPADEDPLPETLLSHQGGH